MTDDLRESRDDAQAGLEQEIRERRKFSPAEAIARLAGPGAMKGASPVSRQQQAETETGCWLRSHVADPSGVLAEVLHRHLKGSALLLDHLDRPLDALAEYLWRLLASAPLLDELVREADVEWGQRMGERPCFERPGAAADPDDPYTAESVRRILSQTLAELEGQPF